MYFALLGFRFSCVFRVLKGCKLYCISIVFASTFGTFVCLGAEYVLGLWIHISLIVTFAKETLFGLLEPCKTIGFALLQSAPVVCLCI
jgi:hypothetical protein